MELCGVIMLAPQRHPVVVVMFPLPSSDSERLRRLVLGLGRAEPRDYVNITRSRLSCFSSPTSWPSTLESTLYVVRIYATICVGGLCP